MTCIGRRRPGPGLAGPSVFTISIPGVCLSAGVLVWQMGAGRGGWLFCLSMQKRNSLYLSIPQPCRSLRHRGTAWRSWTHPCQTDTRREEQSAKWERCCVARRGDPSEASLEAEDSLMPEVCHLPRLSVCPPRGFQVNTHLDPNEECPHFSPQTLGLAYLPSLAHL